MGKKVYVDARKPKGRNMMGDAINLCFVQPGISLGITSSSS